MNKIAVYYIATNKYTTLFLTFISSVNNLFPYVEKVVHYITDDEKRDYECPDNVSITYHHVNHYPWPIITLYKEWHILQNWDETCDYACYFNANSVIYPHAIDIFDLDKLNTSYHSFNDHTHRYDPWYAININKASTAYIENNTYDYIQAAFFFGRSSIVKQMCEDIINNMLWIDTNNYLFPLWHDESYLNKWCVLNKDIVYKDYYLTVYDDSITNKTFILLSNASFKENIKINFKVGT